MKSAPSAIARSTSVPLRTPLSSNTLQRPPTASTMPGNASIVAGAASDYLEDPGDAAFMAVAYAASERCRRERCASDSLTTPLITSAPVQWSRIIFR